MQENKKLAQSAALQIAGKILAVVFGLLTVLILTRYLGTEGYGQLTIVLSFLSIFAVIVDFGLTLTTAQMISEHKADEEKLIGNLLVIRVITASTFLALAPIVALAFPYSSVVEIGIAIGAVSYLFGSTAQMMIGIFQKRLVIGRAVLAELVNRMLVLVGAIAAPFLHIDLLGIMWFFVAGNAAQLAFTIYFARKFVRITPKINLHIWKEIVKRSWPIGASIFFNLIYLRGDILFLSIYRSEAEIGLYGAAFKIVDVITVIPVMFMGLILPRLVADWSRNAKDSFYKHLQNTFDFFSILSIPFIAGCILLSTPVMILIGGVEYTGAGPALALIGPAASVLFFGSLFGHAIVGINKQKPMVLAYAFVAVITVIGYITFIPQHGIIAAAWWTLISETLIALIAFIVVWRVSGFFPNLTMLARATFATIIMSIAIVLTPQIHILLTIAGACTVYFVALAALGGPKPKDVKRLFLPEKPPIAQP